MAEGLRRCVGITLVLLAIAAPAGALQETGVRGRAIDGTSGQPLQGALITLRTEGGQAVLQRLSNPLGRFAFVDLEPGRYYLQADLLGYAEHVSEPFEVTRGSVVNIESPLSVEAILIGGLDVEGERRCGLDPEDGLTLARVWREVREALSRAAFAGNVAYGYEVESVERHWNRNLTDITSEQLTPELIVSGVPYVSLGADVFEEKGYVFRSEDGVIDYYGPDAHVLLSDMFTQTHCFRLERGEEESEGLIGLAFEPVDDRDVPEIEGVMWVEPESARLRWVEFRYEGVARGSVGNRLGGRMDFTELPNGTWIIDNWFIRLPRVGFGAAGSWGVDGRRFTRAEILGIYEVGARVKRVRGPDGEPVLDAEAGLVRGIVVTELGEVPLSGVLVEVVGMGRVARTNARGEFRFTGVPIGAYRFRFTAPNGTVLGEVVEAAQPGQQTFLRLIVGG